MSLWLYLDVNKQHLFVVADIIYVLVFVGFVCRYCHAMIDLVWLSFQNSCDIFCWTFKCFLWKLCCNWKVTWVKVTFWQSFSKTIEITSCMLFIELCHHEHALAYFITVDNPGNAFPRWQLAWIYVLHFRNRAGCKKIEKQPWYFLIYLWMLEITKATKQSHRFCEESLPYFGMNCVIKKKS